MKKNLTNNKQLISLILLLGILSTGLFLGNFVNQSTNGIPAEENESQYNPNVPETSATRTDYRWFNDSWLYRFAVNVSANDATQNNVPVELYVNFTEYLTDPDLGLDPNSLEFDINSIRVIEYTTKTSFVEIPSQFEPYGTYDNQTNAIGDLIWIMNGTSEPSQVRNYFVYFNNASEIVPDPNYDTIRIWHEGFESLQREDINSFGGNQDAEEDDFEITDSTSTRGFKSLHVWGNCWKSIDIGQIIDVGSNIYATAQMRFDDPDPEREISGIGFHTSTQTGPDPSNSYKIRGTQPWGINTYENDYYDDQKFFWYTFNLSDSTDGIDNEDFEQIIIIADDDRSDSNRPDLYWDDISIWAQEVNTVPDHPILVDKGEIEQIASDLTITCVDIDGFKVSNARVYIENDTMPYLDKNTLTDNQGEAFFYNVTSGDLYNITVEYTQKGLSNPETVSFSYKDYEITSEIHNEFVFKLDLWTIFFNVTNRDGEPLDNAYVKIDNGTNDLGMEYLDTNGLCNITWVNQTEYNYSIYYDYSRLIDEVSYHNVEQFIYNSSISREYVDTPKYESYEEQITSDNWDDWNILSGSSENDIRATKIFKPANGTIFSEFNVSVKEVNDYLKRFTVDLYSKGKWYENVYDFSNEKEYVDNHSFYFNYTNTPDNKYHPSLLRLTIRKYNDTATPHGTFNITYVENSYKSIHTNVSTVFFNVTDQDGGDNYLENARIEVFNKTDSPSYPSVANLTVQEDGSAEFIGLNNQTENWGNYTLKIWFAGQYRPFREYLGEFDDNFNITFNTKLNFSFQVNLNLEDYNMTFSALDTDPIDLQNDFYWGNSIDLEFDVYKNEPGALETPTTPDQISLQILDTDYGLIGESINLLSNETETGHFAYTLNTSNYHLEGDTSYNLRIKAEKSGYKSPEPIIKGFFVNSIPTSMSIHNTTSPSLAQLPDNATVYYNELVYLTVKYSSAAGPITGATVTYDWQFESNPVSIQADGNHYSFIINTSKVTNVGKYQLKISATKQNYSSVINFGFDLIILRRPTSVNGLTKLQHISQRIWVRQAVNYTFEYNDTLIDKRLGNLDEAFYHWYELDEQGNQIGNVSDDIELYQTNDSLYVLDFNTKDKEVGYYALFVTFHKNNYETRSVVIDLTIRKRVFNTSLSATNLQGSQVNVVQGNDVELTLRMEDPTNDGDPLTGADVSLQIGNDKYEFNETEDGVYTYTFSTDQINTLLASKTFSGNITIIKEDFETQTLPITIAVGMTEIFPGMPTFYFIMIVGAAIAVAGSLATYRYIQLARIPEFVKRARSMKKDIKGGKTIDKSLLYPSKKEFMVDQLSDRWEELGLSLANILGVETKESKMIKKKTPSEKIKTKEPKEEEIKTKTPETEPESKEEGGAE